MLRGVIIIGRGVEVGWLGAEARSRGVKCGKGPKDEVDQLSERYCT